VSLVHPSQTGTALQSKTHPAWATTAFDVGNEHWQAWFVLQRVSPGTRWELETAYRTLGRDRVAVVARAGYAQHFAGSLVFEYPPERPAQMTLTQWIHWVVASQLGARPR
jgi:hypothetical protein